MTGDLCAQVGGNIVSGMEIDLALHLGDQGWMEFFLPERTPRILAKLEERDGHWHIVRLIIDGDLETATLRELPYGRMNSMLNNSRTFIPDEQGIVSSSNPSRPTTSDEIREAWKRGRAPTETRAVERAINAYLAASAVPPAAKTRTRKREPLTRPDGTDPDSFYRDVADRYTELVMETKAPAKALADEANVPVSSVHRWIRQARARGFLAAGRKGRAG
jgi:hypothetical protein